MLRMFAAAVLSLAFMAGGLLAEEVKGKVKSVDADKKVIVVTVDGKDKEYTLANDASVVNANGKNVKDGLKAKQLKEGANVTLTTSKKDGKDVVTEVKLGGGKKNKQDK